ncbi:hypothetical protein OYE22_31265 [Streptomyces sp. 71268]|uniref:hypothetical protein n=1 Tax=Streptomyces sp. 71268 TaxID=3002640 RepID=UPI0023F76A86|nr:hypothetical protein [Streptomyces sp. 71268]WEV29168.1 hypothetical protein OYE22_31265 [Streptomyces sp. 71268]
MTTQQATAQLSDVQDRVLDDVLVGMPYNSASQFHEYYGTRAAPERFGASCAWQSFAAGHAVAERTGVEADYLIDGRHVAAVYRDPECVTLLDPYLLHQRPPRLERAAAVDGEVRVTVDAYPLRVRADGSPAPARMRATWLLDDDSIRLDYVRYSPRRGHNVLSRSFTLRPDVRLAAVPPPAEWVRPLLVHPEQHSVSVRVVHPDTRRMAELILPLARAHGGAAAGASALVTKDNQGVVSAYGSAAFQRDAELVADAVQATEADVTAFLLEAAAIHRAVAPAGLELAAYSLEDE